MSRKSEFLATLKAAIARMGGAHLTREARGRTAERFADAMHFNGFTHLVRVSDVGGKQLRAYVMLRKESGVSVRTLQNELAHLRSMLRLNGRPAVADAPELSNEALGASGGSRIGTKTAMSDEELERVCVLAERQKRPGMAALLKLERHLGIRGLEAIHARSDTLARWKEELLRHGRFNVVAGTKGGRSRVVAISCRDSALRAISEAQDVANRQAGFLVVRRGGMPVGGLKQARSIYHSWMSRAGVTPHAARYGFAQDQMRAYLHAGFSPREALIAVSHDLGHGDGRGRWVKSVYMR